MSKSFFAIAMCIAVVACNQKESETHKAINFTAPVVDSISQAAPPEFDNKNEGDKSQQTIIPVEKKIVKTASITVVTDSIEKFRAYLRLAVKNVNGYVSNENYSQNEDAKSLQLSVKVPVDQFDRFLENALQKDVIIEQKSITAEDVTGQYRDSKLIADSKRQIRLRYLEMLSKARTVSEMLEVQNAINSIQEEIDLYQGRVLYLSQTAAYSTLDITIKTKSNKDASSSWLKLRDALMIGWHGVAAISLLILSLWPLWIVLGVSYFIVKKNWKKGTKSSKS